MLSRELVQQYKQAAWRRPQDVEAFVRRAAEAAPADLLKLLEIAQGSARGAPAQRAQVRALAELLPSRGDRTLFLPLARALPRFDAEAQKQLAPAVASLNDAHAHADVAALLRQPEPEVRRAAAELLALVAPRGVFDSLLEWCGEPTFPGRLEALAVTVRVGLHRALPALRATLKVGTGSEQLAALGYLADPRIGGKDPAGVLEAVRPLLSHSDAMVAVAAVKTCAALCDEDAFFAVVAPLADAEREAVALTALDALSRHPGARAVALLGQRLVASTGPVALAAAEALSAQPFDLALGALCAAIIARDDEVGRRCAQLLFERSAQLNGPQRVLALNHLLRSEAPRCLELARALLPAGTADTLAACEELLGVLRAEDLWTRARAAPLLAEQGGRGLCRRLYALLNDADPEMRRFAIGVLEGLKDPFAPGLLLQVAAHDRDWWTQERAVEAIASYADARVVAGLLKLLEARPALAVVVLRALAGLRAHAAAPRVIALLGSPDPAVLVAALECLAEIGEPAHSHAVLPLCEHADPGVRAGASALLGRWGIAARGGTRSMLEAILEAMVERGGDDLLLAVGRRPSIKRMGALEPLAFGALSAEQVATLLAPLLPEVKQAGLRAGRDVDTTFSPGGALPRFRVNVFRQHAGLSAVFRVVKDGRPALETLGLPPVVAELAKLRDGLVLVGGATGSGKSTTLASLVDLINRTESRHVVSLEDPIEVVHPSQRSLVSQRQVGQHSRSFAAGVKAALRQDVDVLLVGELRDRETLEAAMAAAETGMLVLGTVHAVSADATVDRVVNAFPSERQEAVRAMLASTLRAVVCQQLVPRLDGAGRCLAAEVMLQTPAIANLIRRNQSFQLASVIATSRELGMQLLDQDLMRLVQAGLVRPEEGWLRARGKAEFEPLLASAAAAPSDSTSRAA